MLRYLAAALVGAVVTTPSAARITPFAASFKTQLVQTNGTSLYVRVGGKGPALVLLHGFGVTGGMWGPLAAELGQDTTLILPDLRGLAPCMMRSSSSPRSARMPPITKPSSRRAAN